jgi:hypothetical protein
MDEGLDAEELVETKSTSGTCWSAFGAQYDECSPAPARRPARSRGLAPRFEREYCRAGQKSHAA